MSKGKYYITTAIAYASGKPHIGNTYEIILADSIARFKRLQGYEVFMQTGTDEHGQKIELKAKNDNKSPQEFVDEISGQIKSIYDLMNTSYDKFIRTSDVYHKKEIQKIFKKLFEKGDIYKGHYEGKYCTACESFFTDQQLVEGKCPDCEGAVYPAKEEAYFFKMSKYADRLMKHIEENPTFIQPESRKNEMINNFLKPGLTDLCVSRTSFSWGIPVDFDEKHVVYVWIDALCNYITGLGYDILEESENFKKFWPADLHLIGKDILRFHTIYWPIILMALDLPLPKQVFGHPWLLTSEGKMSKSKGNVIYADDLVEIFSVDAVRYFVLHEMPFESDGVISWDLILERYDSELANTLGNLVNRTIVMANKYLDGKVSKTGILEEYDQNLKEVVTTTIDRVEEKMKTLHVADAITEIFKLFKRSNKYIDETMPWILGKDVSKYDRLSEVLYNLIEAITIGVNLLEPFMPETSKKILEQLYPNNANDGKRSYDTLRTFGLREDNLEVTKNPTILYARMDEKELAKKLEEIEKKKSTLSKKETKQNEKNAKELNATSLISIDDFAKIKLEVGEILECEEVEKSEKLLVSKVKVKDRVLQIVSGIRKDYKKEEMIGKKVAVLVNLKPAKLCGTLSEGMILAASDENGLSLLSFDKDISVGSGIF